VCRWVRGRGGARARPLLVGTQGGSGRRHPDALVDEIALCGPRERIKERPSCGTTSGVTTMICGMGQVEALRTIAELVL
jgi:hypothetical protein